MQRTDLCNRRGRYAPSPSGRLHLGNARTALIAWLQMRSIGGQFILRMEDIDKQRCKPEYAGLVMEDLRWFGLDWDEGPDVGGPFSPYTQTERESMYEEALHNLLREHHVYPCTCTRAKLQEIASAPHGLSSEGPAYPGICRAKQLDVATIQAPYSLRFAMPEQSCEWFDDIHGSARYDRGAGGDFIVRRSDGMFGYQLAVVVDDAAMGVTHVLRGDDLLDSTPRQLALYRALGYEVPQFAHLPLVLGPDGSRLSKRHRAITLHDFRKQGVTPEQLTGYLAFWSGLLDKPVPVKCRELIAEFRMDRLMRNAFQLTDSMLASLTKV